MSIHQTTTATTAAEYAARYLDATTYSFDMTLLRGRNDREVPVLVTYRAGLDGIEIVSVKGADGLNTYEWDDIEQEAADHFAEQDELEAAVSFRRSCAGMV